MPTDNANLTDQQQHDARLAALRAAIDEGVAEGDVFARVREAFNLPTERR
jgi:hypothetical protein